MSAPYARLEALARADSERDAFEDWYCADAAKNGLTFYPAEIAALRDGNAPWFREAWARCDLVMFTPKIKFIRPDGSVGISPGTGTCLWASGGQGVLALRRAASRGLGILATPSLDIAA